MDGTTVQEYRDGNGNHFQKIVIYHIPLIDKIIWKYTCPRHTFEDLQEVAYYELVVGIKQAQKALQDNNITPYVLRWVGLNLLSYVTVDHLIIYPKKISSRVVNLIHRRTFDDTPNRVNVVPIDVMIFWEHFESCITSDEQREIVDLRLQGYTLCEIANRIPNRSIMYIQRRWLNFVTRVTQ